MVKLTAFDAAAHLADDEARSGFLSEALATGNPAYVAHALGVVARSRGMADVARQAGLSRQSLYRALGEGGNPALDTILKVVQALGIQLQAAPAPAPRPAKAPRRTTRRSGPAKAA
jgi:probable addiction module antidote protein